MDVVLKKIANAPQKTTAERARLPPFFCDTKPRGKKQDLYRVRLVKKRR